MAVEHDAQTFRHDNTYPFSASVTAEPLGGWITTIDLGDGATVSHWFESEVEARSYPDEISAWLEERRSA